MSMEPAIAFMKTVASPVIRSITATGTMKCRLRQETGIYGDMYARYERADRSRGYISCPTTMPSFLAGNTFVNVYGYELEMAYYQKFNQLELTKGQLEQALGEADRRRFTILIAHNPVYGETYAGLGADLMVSGHLYGGIIRLPFIGGVITPPGQAVSQI